MPNVNIQRDGVGMFVGIAIASVCLASVGASVDDSWDRDAAEALVAKWCDALVARQITGMPDRMLEGGIVCPACGVLHGRICDLAYPLVYRWVRTGERKYLTAAEKAVDWTEATMRRSDGGVYNDFQSYWWATTTFAQIALGKVLFFYGDRLPERTRERWLTIFRRETDFLIARFDEKFMAGVNVNYPAAFCEALALAGRVLGDPDKTSRAKVMADRLKAQFLPDGLVTGEGASMERRSPRGLAYVDLGYNLEETLPSLLAYAELCDDGRMKHAVLTSAVAHAEFLLPDGGLDNSFGSRSAKWTYYGSRTSDGMLPVLGALAKSGTPWAVRALDRQLRLYERCTNSAGLLAGGVQYEAANEPACVHQAFSHVKSLVDLLRDPSVPLSSSAAALPRECVYGLKVFPSMGVSLASVGSWRITFAGGDAFKRDKFGQRVTGGGPSLVWHETVGPVIVGTMADYDIIEPRNLQDLRHERLVLSMMPRLELGGCFSSAREANAEVATSFVSNVVTCIAHGNLTGPNGEKGAAYGISSRVDAVAFSLAGSCEENARLVLPVIALPTDRVEIAGNRVRIIRESAVVTVESDLSFELARTDRGDRAFSPIGGFLYAYLTAPVRAGRAFAVRVCVETL